MGDFGCCIWPTSPDPFLGAFDEDLGAARRLLLDAFLVLEVLAREPLAAAFLLFLLTIVLRGLSCVPFLVSEGTVANAEPTMQAARALR